MRATMFELCLPGHPLQEQVFGSKNKSPLLVLISTAAIFHRLDIIGMDICITENSRAEFYIACHRRGIASVEAQAILKTLTLTDEDFDVTFDERILATSSLSSRINA